MRARRLSASRWSPGPASAACSWSIRCAQQRITQVRGVRGPADQLLTQRVGVEVEHPLAEPVPGRGPAVVRDVRRQQRDLGRRRAVVRPIEVVADHAVVDHQQGPRVVGVQGVGVLHEAGMEDLGDPRHGGLPRLHPLHAKNVQDERGRSGRRWYG